MPLYEAPPFFWLSLDLLWQVLEAVECGQLKHSAPAPVIEEVFAAGRQWRILYLATGWEQAREQVAELFSLDCQSFFFFLVLHELRLPLSIRFSFVRVVVMAIGLAPLAG